MDFVALVDQVIALLRQRGRVTYRTLQRQFQLDADALTDLLGELRYAHRDAIREDEQGIVWTDDARPTHPATATPAEPATPAPLTYTPAYLSEKVLTSRSTLEGERKQVTVLFADLKSSMELLAHRDPEEARQLLDPVLEQMMVAVHRYEGTVNQVMGDGIMALFGAPLAHEDHAVRACYAALAMQEAMRRYSAEVRRTHGVEVQMRVGLNNGEVVVRAIDNDLHMDYSAVGLTTVLAARMEQLAMPGSVRLTAATLRLVEGLLQVTALGPVPVKGLADAVEVFELVGASALRSALAPSGDLGRILALLREAESLAAALDDPRRLGQVSRFLANYFLLMGAYDQAIATAQRALALAPQPGGMSSCRRWRIATSVLPTMSRASIVGRSITSGRPWRPSTGLGAMSVSVKSACPQCNPELNSPCAMPSWARSPRALPSGKKGCGLPRRSIIPRASCGAIGGLACCPYTTATCLRRSPCSNGP